MERFEDQEKAEQIRIFEENTLKDINSSELKNQYNDEEYQDMRRINNIKFSNSKQSKILE